MFALTVTLIFEIPVLLMISGGSDALCQLVGRTKYQLLMGFIPLTSAISGNVGLQASTLTTRAISHDHVTPSKYLPWFGHEVGAACVLGLGMGTLLATIAFFASLYDVAFALTIFVAQFISIVTAGCTGTFAPLLFSFIFRRDSGKWGGPLETAIQDIVGSFAMVIISYRILLLLGAGPVDPNDVCSAVTADNVGR
jgi:Mg/Co/Ni transporter MgtE